MMSGSYTLRSQMSSAGAAGGRTTPGFPGVGQASPAMYTGHSRKGSFSSMGEY